MCSSFITCNHIVYMLIYSSLQINLPESVINRLYAIDAILRHAHIKLKTR